MRLCPLYALYLAWKPKAIRRYTKLFDEGRLKPEKLFYGDIVGKTWEETKEQYLKEVGR